MSGPTSESPWTGQYVYFAERDGRIKIGCSCDPARRLSEIGRPTLLAVILGDFQVERALHRRFAAQALGHEWFAPSPELRSLIATLPADVAEGQDRAGHPRAVPRVMTFIDNSTPRSSDVPPPGIDDRYAAFLFGEACQRPYLRDLSW